MPELSHAAASTVQAFNDRYERPLEEHNWKEACLAAALRAAADQVAPALPESELGDPEILKGIWGERRTIRAELLAIADELEGITYGTYRCNLKAQ